MPGITSDITINGNGFVIECNSSLLCYDGRLSQFCIFYVTSAGNITLDGVTVRNGSEVGYNHGGIYNEVGTVSIIESTLSENEAHTGGGIYNDADGKVNISNSTLSGNSANNRDGGVGNNGRLVSLSRKGH